MYMLDTNTVSDIVKARSPRARRTFAELALYQSACLSAVTEAELRYGLAKAGPDALWKTAVESFLNKAQVLDWGRHEAAVYGQLRASQEKMGKSLKNLDMMIGAHAVAVSAILVTRDKAFSRVPELRSINWATDIQ